MDLHLKTINYRDKTGQLFFRCPIELKQEISTRAKRSGRSIATEVVIRLIKSLQEHEYITFANE